MNISRDRMKSARNVKSNMLTVNQRQNGLGTEDNKCALIHQYIFTRKIGHIQWPRSCTKTTSSLTARMHYKYGSTLEILLVSTGSY